MNDFQKYVSQNKDRAKEVGPGVYRIPLVQEELTPSFKLNSPYMQGAENGGLYAFVDSTGNIIPNQDIEYDSSDNQYYKVTHLPDTKVEAPSLSAYNDPNYTNILTGNYYGHKFVPTEQNVKYYQKLYENDHKIREGYGPHGLAQLGGVLGVGAALATTGAYAPTIAGWTYRTALPWVAENLAVPTIVAESVDLAQNALFGTTSSETVSNFLQDNLHVSQPIADFAGEATNPGWYVPSSYGVKLFNTVKTGLNNVYNNGTLWDKYTTLGGRFGYYGNPLQRVWGTVSRNLGIPSAPKHPELLRKLDGVPYLTENGLLNFNTTRTGLLGEGHSNWTFDRPVVSHSKGNWDGKDLYIIDPEEFQKVVSKENVKSIEPSDVFVQDANAFINPKRVTLVSGNPESLIQARKMGMSTLSSPRLRGLYKPGTKIGRFSLDKGNYGNLPYALEQQRLQQRRGVPTLSDFRFIEDQYGLKAGVIPISEYLQNSLSDAVENMLQNPTQIGTWTYPNGREVQLIPGGTYINKALYQRNLVEKAPYNNVFYDPASPIEINSGVTNRKK